VAGTLEENGIHFAGCADDDCIGRLAAYDFVTVAAAAAAWNQRGPGTAPAAASTARATGATGITRAADATPAQPAATPAGDPAELAAFHAWLQADEQAHGCRGLSSLERHQMRDAWLARAVRGPAR
jgi:hypothetical protein